MTRTGALVWKEWRDHRVALAVFAVLVPLVSWPVQRWVFKFAEPAWTWTWVVPLCAGLAVAVVASDLFAMDLATSRMPAFAALPVPVRSHFAARTAFLSAVAVAFAAWAVAANVVLVGVWGKPGAAGTLLGSFDPALAGVSICAAVTAAVVVLSGLGIGGFRAVLGGLVLATLGYWAMRYAADFVFPLPQFTSAPPSRDPLAWLVAAAVLAVAAFAGFVGGRAHAAGRKRGAWIVAAVLVGAFGLPSGAAAWNAYRSWAIVPTDPELVLQQCTVSPEGRYVAVWGQRSQGGQRSWVVRVEDGALFDWPRRNEGVAGWTTDGLAWVGRMSGDDLGRFARPETGETVERAGPDAAAINRRMASGWGADPKWAQWLRRSWENARPASKGVAPTYRYRLWEKDGAAERTFETRTMPAAMPAVGEVLFVTPNGKLAHARLAGGEPEIVWDDALDLSGFMAGSPDGRYFTVGTSKGYVVLDSQGWKQVAGPWSNVYTQWCLGDSAPATLVVSDRKSFQVIHVVEVPTGREIAIHRSLDGISGHGGLQRLPDGRFLARSGSNRLVLLDADGKYIRRLFPPEE